MIREWVPGGHRLGRCPSCGRGDGLQYESRAEYEAYHEWFDGKLSGRCRICGYQLTVQVSAGRGFDAVILLLAEAWRDEVCRSLNTRGAAGRRARSAGGGTT